MGLSLFGDRFGGDGSGIPENKEEFWVLKDVLIIYRF
jgi:hypothetical protein